MVSNKLKQNRQASCFISKDYFLETLKSFSNSHHTLYDKLFPLFKYLNLKNIEYFNRSFLKKYKLVTKTELKPCKAYYLGIYDRQGKTYQCQLTKEACCVVITLIDISKSSVTIQNKTEKSMKENVFSKIAHEVKTPIMMIMNMNSQMLNYNEKAMIEKAIELCRISKSYSLFLNHQINDMIKLFSLNSFDDIIINKQILSISDIINETFSLLKCLVYLSSEKRDISLELNLEEEIKNLDIECDYDIINQIFHHLLTNAINFTQKGSISIECGILRSTNKALTNRNPNEKEIKIQKYFSYNNNFINPLKEQKLYIKQ